MAKNLVIVESPAKAKTINKFIGKDYVDALQQDEKVQERRRRRRGRRRIDRGSPIAHRRKHKT